VYLPAGEWVDYFTGERHTGPVTVERPVPLDEIPVYSLRDHRA
jgi:alpha-glucosidase (family GH31 glycosyl hydrolase)